jgi:hypothetical protein
MTDNAVAAILIAVIISFAYCANADYERAHELRLRATEDSAQ